jgi:hypothetical protein
MPPSRDSFRRNRVAPIDGSILAPLARSDASCPPTFPKTVGGKTLQDRFRLNSLFDELCQEPQSSPTIQSIQGAIRKVSDKLKALSQGYLLRFTYYVGKGTEQGRMACSGARAQM